MYFKSHPLIEYNNEEVVDIFRSTRLLKKLNTNAFLFRKYNIQDKETPESLAFKLYGNSEYHWTILLINNIVNINRHWPMSLNALNTYINTKYTNPNGIHHYEDADGHIVDLDTQDTSQVIISNYDYEVKVNTEKSSIKVLHSSNISKFVNEFKNIIKGPKFVKKFVKVI